MLKYSDYEKIFFFRSTLEQSRRPLPSTQPVRKISIWRALYNLFTWNKRYPSNKK